MPASVSVVCHDLSFAWPDGTPVLDRLDVRFPAGTTGLVGRNGTGKSTLVRLIVGELTPTGGSVSGAERLGYLPQDLVLSPDRTVADVLGVAAPLAALARIDAGAGTSHDFAILADRWELEAEVAATLAGLGLDRIGLDRIVGTVSGGEAMLLALAGLFLARPDVLVLDEPTNNLDAGARARFADAVAAWTGPVLVISHDRDLLERCDQIAELRDGAVRIFGGPFSAYEAALAVEQEAARRAVRTAESDLRRQRRELVDNQIKLDRRKRYGSTAYEQKREPRIKMNEMKRTAQVSAAKLKGDHEADVASAREQLEAAAERVRDDDVIDIALPATRVPAGRDVLVTTDLVLRHGLVVELHLRGPERIGLVGPNGVGKTTLIDTVLGRLAPAAGMVELRVPARLLPQRLRLLDDAVPVITSVSRLAPGADDNALRAQLARFLLPATTVLRPAGTLSGGERFRASLAALLLAEPAPQLLVLDEPTNNLDLDSVTQLVAALRGYQGALLVASHDARFLAELELTGTLDLGTVRPDGGVPVVVPA